MTPASPSVLAGSACPKCGVLTDERTSTGNAYCRMCDYVFTWRPIRVLKAGESREYKLGRSPAEWSEDATAPEPAPSVRELVARLRALAEKATKGERQARTYRTVTEVRICGDKRPLIHWMGFDGNDLSRRENNANARFIAACDPQTILALCDALDALGAPTQEPATTETPFRFYHLLRQPDGAWFWVFAAAGDSGVAKTQEEALRIVQDHVARREPQP